MVDDTVVPFIFHSKRLHRPASVPCHFLRNVLYSRYPRYSSSSRALKPCSGDQEQISPKFLTYVSNVFRRMQSGERPGTIWRSWHRLWCYPGLGYRRHCDANLLFTGSERKQIKAAWEKRYVRKHREESGSRWSSRWGRNPANPIHSCRLDMTAWWMNAHPGGISGGRCEAMFTM